MLVQSFVDDDERNHYIDFSQFMGLFGAQPRKGELILLNETKRRLSVGWVQSPYHGRNGD